MPAVMPKEGEMKKSIALTVVLSVLLVGCGQPQYLGEPGQNKILYPTYGLINESSSKSKNVCYEISVGNVIWSIILIETIIFPVYFIGWSLWNPVRLKKGPDDQCAFDS
jgi:hypothetical protein